MSQLDVINLIIPIASTVILVIWLASSLRKALIILPFIFIFIFIFWFTVGQVKFKQVSPSLIITTPADTEWHKSFNRN